MSDTVSFGYEDVPRDEKVARVGSVFTNVAAKYDLMNDAMSGGMHRLWKDRFVRRVKPRASDQILDMAGGTGDIAFRLAESGASITVADINPAMLEVGMKRAAERGFDELVWTEANAESLTFPTNSSTPIRSRSAFGTSPTSRRHCVRRTGSCGAAGGSSAWNSRPPCGPAFRTCTTPIHTSWCPSWARCWRAMRTAIAI